jgi:hypothetical protein
VEKRRVMCEEELGDEEGAGGMSSREWDLRSRK